MKIKWFTRGLQTLLACLLLPALSAPALENGLARTPPMGWNSWNTFAININEQLIRTTADAMVDTGMKSAGYEYVIVDAGWKAKKRAADGKLVANPQKFPSGIKALADYVHSRGLKFGLYTDAGTEDCDGGGPGSSGHEEIDAATFAAWEVDYVKDDWCKSEGLDAKTSYSKMSAALRATGRPIVLSMCEWGDNSSMVVDCGSRQLVAHDRGQQELLGLRTREYESARWVSPRMDSNPRSPACSSAICWGGPLE